MEGYTYNYLDEIKEDTREYLNDNYDIKYSEDVESLDEGTLNDDLFICDSVTGNASGSYTFNYLKAEENLCGNLSLLVDAMEIFGCSIDLLRNPEACDVTIRCYLLNQALSEVLEELADELPSREDEESGDDN